MKVFTAQSDFAFRAHRDYVLLIDLFRWSVEQAKGMLGGASLTDLQIKLSRGISKNCELHLLEGESEFTEKNPSGLFSFSSGGKLYSGALVETDRAVARRVEFNENPIFENTVLTDGELKLSKDVGYPPIELLIPMTKQMHTKLFPDAKGKWLATGIQLPKELPSAFRTLSLKNTHNFRYKLTKNRILLDGQEAGFTFFSLG